jgi:hypothetical protein
MRHPVVRSLALLVAASCGGGQRAAEPPSARAPELAAVAPGCDGDRLKAFDPGIAGLAQASVAQRPVPDPPLARTHERACTIVESDATCQALARHDVVAADAQAAIGAVSIAGERDGWSATLEVDGVRHSLRVADERDVLVEARRLQARGHQVVPVEGHVVYRADGRKAIVRYEVPVSGAVPPMRWELELRGPVGEGREVAATMERLQQEAQRAELVIVRFEVDVESGISVLMVCP